MMLLTASAVARTKAWVLVLSSPWAWQTASTKARATESMRRSVGRVRVTRGLSGALTFLRTSRLEPGKIGPSIIHWRGKAHPIIHRERALWRVLRPQDPTRSRVSAFPIHGQ